MEQINEQAIERKEETKTERMKAEIRKALSEAPDGLNVTQLGKKVIGNSATKLDLYRAMDMAGEIFGQPSGGSLIYRLTPFAAIVEKEAA